MDMANTVFMFVATVLVWLMTPALALFYGGLVRSKNVLSTAMHSFTTMAIVSIIWIIIGFSLAFSPGNGIIGGLDFFGLNNVGFEPTEGHTIPFNLFMMFQMTFAILTTAIVSGAYAERIRFPAFILFTVLWVLIVYSPLAHWVWGGGWIAEMGALDFAGGNVVHISSGLAGLVVAIVIGKRKNAGTTAPHNLIFTLIGGALLWFGWFGFNVGSELAFDDVAMYAFINTNTAAASGVLGWMIIEWVVNKKPTLLGAVSGAIAGLVAITPAAGFVSPIASIPIGFIGGIVCFWGVGWLKQKLGYDDALDAFGLHAVGGTWGGIATGLFASDSINAIVEHNGLFYGGGIDLLWRQVVAIIATFAFVGVVTFILITIVNLIFKARATDEEEAKGLDLTMHGERAYQD
ncbi:ammonium transporter [Terribacillus saccharophilus]|uniref:Ammonium transporter n=1 Tax=Terribacillus saccharophilus TaxID=361277 RepID=A0AAX2EF00_9BACI|nr:ammonium transporter [Terribacillus goriensis]MEC0282260.1 ammonium transporter [Terribacillus saccharophilus]MEC0288981.1 ammonium transporter [Terribacillus saccharophilus]SEN21135.1 ammonium transporter [Terribacillus saccharophilus]